MRDTAWHGVDTGPPDRVWPHDSVGQDGFYAETCDTP